ncbi:hypothetical protein QUF55_00820 [Clostridiaceae bacterium HSG29]|nr:hypothetical protein [Clostridiaceae bacterium HSG29]
MSDKYDRNIMIFSNNSGSLEMNFINTLSRIIALSVLGIGLFFYFKKTN